MSRDGARPDLEREHSVRRAVAAGSASLRPQREAVRHANGVGRRRRKSLVERKGERCLAVGAQEEERSAASSTLGTVPAGIHRLAKCGSVIRENHRPRSRSTGASPER
jgi:hypothetical protein